MRKLFKIKEEKELKEVADYLAELSKSQKHFCFTGEMGAGKTTLISLICKKLGVNEHTSSPTYSIVNEYVGSDNKQINHFDLFRITDEFELLDIGIEEILDSPIICFIEWPEKVIRFLPEQFVSVEISVIENVRVIEILV
jgi:tRNA threonylcarbamoyladenosine biosynthesis protein TsaE